MYELFPDAVGLNTPRAPPTLPPPALDETSADGRNDDAVADDFDRAEPPNDDCSGEAGSACGDVIVRVK